MYNTELEISDVERLVFSNTLAKFLGIGHKAPMMMSTTKTLECHHSILRSTNLSCFPQFYVTVSGWPHQSETLPYNSFIYYYCINFASEDFTQGRERINTITSFLIQSQVHYIRSKNIAQMIERYSNTTVTCDTILYID